MENPSPLPPSDRTVWSAIRRFRTVLLAMGLAGVFASIGLTAALLALQPVYLTTTIQVWERLFGPSSGPGGSTEKMYRIEVQHPPEMYLEDDLPIQVSLSDVSNSHKNDPNARVHIKLEGPSFKAVPADGISLELKDGRSASFIVTASAPGNRSIRVIDEFWITDAPNFREAYPSSGPNGLAPRSVSAADARIVNITVREKPLFFFLDRAIMKDVQIAAAIIGIPSLLIFLLSGWREKRKQREQTLREASQKRVTAPQVSKPRRVDQ